MVSETTSNAVVSGVQTTTITRRVEVSTSTLMVTEAYLPKSGMSGLQIAGVIFAVGGALLPIGFIICALVWRRARKIVAYEMGGTCPPIFMLSAMIITAVGRVFTGGGTPTEFLRRDERPWAETNL